VEKASHFIAKVFVEREPLCLHMNVTS